MRIVGYGADRRPIAWCSALIIQGGIGSIDITLVSDFGGEVMNAYGVNHPSHVALRDPFLIGRKGIVRHHVVNDLPLGRKSGELGMKASLEGVVEYLSHHVEKL